MNYYAAIDTTDTVTAIYTSEHDAGHPDVRAWGETVGRWVYCEAPCQVGDVLDVDNDGCATVRETGDEAAPATYTYTIYDGDPASSGPCAWPSHEDVEIEADLPAEVLAEALSEAGLVGDTCGEYSTGDTLWVLVWDADGQQVACGTHTVDTGDEDEDDSAERLQRAAAHIDAVQINEDTWAHYADETSRWYTVDASALEDLCDYLDSDDEQIRSDAYSHWCAGCESKEMSADWTPEAAA